MSKKVSQEGFILRKISGHEILDKSFDFGYEIKTESLLF
jgi:hypothetical protein